MDILKTNLAAITKLETDLVKATKKAKTAITAGQDPAAALAEADRIARELDARKSAAAKSATAAAKSATAAELEETRVVYRGKLEVADACETKAPDVLAKVQRVMASFVDAHRSVLEAADEIEALNSSPGYVAAISGLAEQLRKVPLAIIERRHESELPAAIASGFAGLPGAIRAEAERYIAGAENYVKNRMGI